MQRTVLLFCLFLCALGAYYEESYQQMLREMKGRRIPWQHGLNKNFRGKSQHELKRMYGSRLLDDKARSHLHPYVPSNADKTPIPEFFDARQQWNNCKYTKLIRDQSNCGSCWAVSAASVMSDRVCVATNGMKQPYISDEYLTSCCRFFCHGCNGGSLFGPFICWNYGIPTGGPFNTTFGCQPYSIHCPTCPYIAPTPPCKHACIKEYSGTFESSLHYGNHTHYFLSIEAAQRGIMEKGPIVAGYTVYADFKFYKGGIYQHVWGEPKGGHAVRVIGWGVEEDEPYWLITNSWGAQWAMKGLFKIRRGVNECGIEDNMIAGDPIIFERSFM